MFGEATDPTPYIAAAYAVAAVLLVGYALLQVRLRQRLRSLEQAALVNSSAKGSRR